MKNLNWIIHQDAEKDQYHVVIVNDEWYLENQARLHAWMQQNLAQGHDALLGMVVTFANDKEMMLWDLYWT